LIKIKDFVQGCDFMPHAVSTRTVASFWWFFTLIMISSYTANLAAFLTIDRMDTPISSIQDLAKSDIRYGAVLTGSTTAFFKDSNSQLYRRMCARMREWEGVLVDSNSDGVQKVLEGDGSFAFFMESLGIEYHVERNCRLIQVGGNLDAKSYGIALPKRSNLRPLLSSAIIRLKEKGIISALRQKWWQEERGGGACQINEQVRECEQAHHTQPGGHLCGAGHGPLTRAPHHGSRETLGPLESKQKSYVKGRC
jgi:hypothetical protein